MSKEELIASVIDQCEEYLEMEPESAWVMIAYALAHKLEKQLEETEYYKRMLDVSI